MIVIVLVVFLMMYSVMKKAIAAQRECLRMDSIYRGQIHSLFAMIVNGLTSLRTYERTDWFKKGFIDQLEKSTNVTFCFFAINRWMGISLDIICLFFTFSSASFAVFAKGAINHEVLAFLLQILTDVIVFFSFSIRMYAEIENYFTSFQRITKYTLLESEDLLVKKSGGLLTTAEGTWPQKGKIEFTNVTMRYRETLEPSIRNLHMLIQPKMKVGIVGRTGAGKSSILQTLFRLCELEEGQIKIDDIDITTVGLHALRRNIAFIPQTPFLL